MRNNLKDTLVGLILGTIACIIISCFTSCRTVKYVDKVHTEYVKSIDSLWLKDSVYIHDSISMYIKGDTIFRDKFSTVYREKWRDKIKVDTICSVDSIPYTVTVTKKVSNGREPLYVMIIALLVAIIALMAGLWIKGKKKNYL